MLPSDLPDCSSTGSIPGQPPLSAHNPPPDDEEDFDFSSYPDLDTPLYLIPKDDQNHIAVYSPETLRQGQLQEFQPNQLQFQDLLDLHKFCCAPAFDISQYWIVLPATYYRYIRRHYYRRDLPASFPIYISKLPQ